MPAQIMDSVQQRVFLLDGGFGTELIKQGFQAGTCPESWNTEKPEAVKGIHQDYYAAGADAVSTNSFGGSAIKLAAYGLGDSCYDFNRKAAELARSVCPDGKYVVGSMGPTGKFLMPQGEYSEEQFENAFAEQARGLSDGSVDAILLETHYDLKEAMCALRGVRRHAPSLPVWVTLTFNQTPRGFFTIMGNSVSDFVSEMEAASIPALGSNCTLDSLQMVELSKDLRAATSLPIIIQANAGQPEIGDDGDVVYTQPLQEYVKHIPEILDGGADIVGGCCGTDPDYIRAMADIIRAA
jgi:5-methyltetrahydrofolate--homocysteine methyltransferase